VFEGVYETDLRGGDFTCAAAAWEALDLDVDPGRSVGPGETSAFLVRA